MTNDFNEIELRKLDLNLLLVFSALMRERGVALAAGRLYLGPSAVSMALGRLRASLGDPLFVRTATGLEPTPRAVSLWLELEPALQAIEDAVRGGRRFDPARASLTIRFGAPDDLEFLLIPRLLERLTAEAPGVRLVVRPSEFRTLLDRLDTGDADLALSATPERGIARRHRVSRLHQEDFSVLYDPGQLGCQGPLDIETWLAVPHLLLSVTGDLHGAIDDALAGIGSARRVLAALAHFPTMPFILRRQAVLVNMPSLAARHFAAAYDLACVPLPVPSPRFEVALIWHVRTDADPAHVWFRDLVAGLVEEIRTPVK